MCSYYYNNILNIISCFFRVINLVISAYYLYSITRGCARLEAVNAKYAVFHNALAFAGTHFSKVIVNKIAT